LGLKDYITNLSAGTVQDGSKNKRIKLNLSVPELAALIRLLYEYNLFGEIPKMSLYRLIAEYFETKKGGPTADSLNKECANILSNGFDFWEENHTKIFGNIHKLRNSKPLHKNTLVK
jgi:hypothetical protein